MQVFEFHFSPPSKNDLKKQGLDLLFDSFSYEPANISEKKLGSLYMVGILKNVLPQNINFLENLAKTIKERYYKTVFTGAEKNLKDALKKANENLEIISKKGDVSWLGNFGFVAMAIVKSNLYFTKVGETKVYLLRSGQIIDIDHKLETEDIEPYPLKVFGNIISGKLAQNDIILILTKDIANVFLKETILNKITKLSFLPSSENLFKSIKEILSLRKEQLLKSPGVCLAISCSEKPFLKQKETLTQLKNLKIFSIKEIFSPVAVFVKQSIKKIEALFQKLKLRLWPWPIGKNSSITSPSRGSQRKVKDESRNIRSSTKPSGESEGLRQERNPRHIPFAVFGQISKITSFFYPTQKTVLVLSLILFLSFGYLVFQKKEAAQLKVYQTELNRIQEKINQAETYLVVSKTNPQAQKKANILFKESWEEISPLIIIVSTLPTSIANQIIKSKDKILENLYQLNKLEIVKDPSLFAEIKPREFVPQKMVFFQDNIYIFNSYAKNLFEVNQKGEGHIINFDKKIDFAYAETASLLLFSKPNELIIFKNGQFQSPFLLEPPAADFNFTNFASYLFNLYFTQENEIIKYQSVKESQWGPPQSWLNPKIKIATDFKSMATDGSIWILTKANTVKKYYLGNLEKTLVLEIFPYPKDLIKIFTAPQLSYLYLLEPGQQRIIITDKTGNVVKQFRSEKFDNLLDFTVSADGKSIYLLNGQKIYKISLF